MPPKKNKKNGTKAPRSDLPARTQRPGPKSRIHGSSYRVTGTEYLGNATIASSDPVGKRLYSTLISADTLGPRIATLNTLFEKYYINSLRFNIQTVGPMTDDVQIIHAFDTDPSDPMPPESLAGLQMLASWNHHQILTHSQTRTRSMPVHIQQPSTGQFGSSSAAGDPRLAYAGNYMLYLIVAAGTAQYGVTISVNYDITFFEPQLQDSLYSAFDQDSRATDTWDYNTGFGFNHLNDTSQIGAIHGVHPTLRSDGKKALRLQPGDYYVRSNVLTPPSDIGQAYPSHILENHHDSIAPATMTNEAVQHSPPVTGTEPGIGYRLSKITVPPGSIADLMMSIIQSGHIPSTSNGIIRTIVSRIGSLI